MIAGRRVTHLEQDAFWRRFGRLEHESLEFKSSPNHLREVIPAMAMTSGGQIVVGVTDDRHLSGWHLDQATLDVIMRRAQETGVDVSVEPLLVAGTPLIVIHVPRVTSRIVTTSDGRLMRRVGGDNRPLQGDQLLGFVRSHISRRSRLARRVAATFRRVAPRPPEGSPQRAPSGARQ